MFSQKQKKRKQNKKGVKMLKVLNRLKVKRGYAGSLFAMIIFIIGILIIIVFNYFHSFKIEYVIVKYVNSENYVMEKLIWLNARPQITDYNDVSGFGVPNDVRSPLDIDDMLGIYEYLAQLKETGYDVSDVMSSYGVINIDDYDYIKSTIKLINAVTPGPFGVINVNGILADYFLYDISVGKIIWDCSSSSFGIAFYLENYKNEESNYHLRAPQSLGNCIQYAKKNPLHNSNFTNSFVVTTKAYLPLFNSVGDDALESLVFFFKTKCVYKKVNSE